MPDSLREKMDARSKRKPSTCISDTQIPQAVENETLDDGVVSLQGVAHTGIVRVGGLVRVQNVVKAVFQPAEAEGGSSLVRFSGMVVYHVENDLDAGPVQLFHHGSKLVQAGQRIVASTVGHVRSKERDWAVTPVIGEARKRILGIELENRQQFDGCDTQFLKIWNLCR